MVARRGELGILFRGAGMFNFTGCSLPFLRLGFAHHNEAELAEAVTRMARAREVYG